MATKKNHEQIEGIEIANPLYDVVFKRLMENSHVASYFVETFIGEKVEDITMLARESTVFKWSRKFEKVNLTSEELERLKKLTVICLDFVATIKTVSGEHKKILIEIQKARDNTDIWRFRNYLAEHYKRKDVIKVNGKTKNEPLPVITIYLLGFNLSETDAVVVSVKRNLSDGITNQELKVKIPFIEFLTHDSYVVQLGRITGKMKTRTEKVLSVFEQRYFIDGKTKISKKYPHETNDKMVRLMLEILEHANADPEQRSEIELEWMSHEVLNSMVLDKDKTITKLQKTIVAKDQTIVEKDQTIVEKDQAIAEKDDALSKANARIAELESRLATKK